MKACGIARRAPVALLAALLCAGSVAGASGVKDAAGAVGAVDDRSREVVRRDCSTTLGRNEVTLFGNGTIRLREWLGDAATLQLAEMGRDELAAYERRLAAIDFRESERRPDGVSGDWLERCSLHLALGNAPPRSFVYGRLDTHDLALASLIRIVDELAATAAARAVSGLLPSDFVPRQGDILARFDGVEFEVMGFTADGKGVELRGRVDPLTIYVPRSDLPVHFRELIRRAR